MRYENVVSDLLATVPEFRPAYEELQADFGVDVGLHVVFGRLFNFTLEACDGKALNLGTSSLSERILQFVERAAASTDDRTRELAAVSYMEHMWMAGSKYQLLKSRFGPAARKLLEEVETT